MKKIKLSVYAKQNNISYRTAWSYYKKGLIDCELTPTGRVLVKVNGEHQTSRVAIYCRVSSSQNKTNLESQKRRLIDYCAARGYRVHKIVCEVGSGLNDNRKKLYGLLDDKTITKIVVEDKDRFSRFGTNYIELLLSHQGRSLEIVNNVEDDKEDLMQDFVSIITSFVARLYGQRRSKRKTENSF